MPVSELGVVERIARVLAAQHLSINALGTERSASEAVDLKWSDYRDDAIAILRTLREPDFVMAGAGDVEVWKRMVDAALEDNGAKTLPFERI